MTNSMSRHLRSQGSTIVNENTQIEKAEESEQNGNGTGANPIQFIQVFFG